MFIFGGRGANGVLFKDVYFLDTKSWCWVRISSTTSGPCARFDHATTVVGNKIVVSCGWDGQKCFGDTWVFNTLSCTWVKPSTRGRNPRPRHGHSLEPTPLGTIIVFGGSDIDATKGTPVYLRDVLSLDMETMGGQGRELSATFLLDDTPTRRAWSVNTCYALVDGFRGCPRMHLSTTLGDRQRIVALNTETMTWSEPASRSRAEHRYGHALVVAETQCIVFGGWGGNRALNDTHVAELFGSIIDWFVAPETSRRYAGRKR